MNCTISYSENTIKTCRFFLLKNIDRLSLYIHNLHFDLKIVSFLCN